MMSDLFQFGSGHPDADQLNAFVEDALPPHEKERTLAHLAVCPECRTIVALSLPVMEESGDAHTLRPWFSGWRLVWLATPALAALAIVGIYLNKPSGKSIKSFKSVTTEVSREPAASAAASDLAVLAPQPSNRAVIKRTPAVMSATPVIVRPPSPPEKLPVAQQATEPIVASGKPAIAVPRTMALAAKGRNIIPAFLPSRLPVLSIVANARVRLAIDTANTLFFSSDQGQTWKAVPAQWSGHAMQVSLVSSSVPEVHQLAPTTGSLPRAAVAGVALTGAVTDTTGTGIPNADLSILNSQNSPVSRARTDREGRYLIEPLAPGTYQLEAKAPGFQTQSVRVAIASGQSTFADFTLPVGQATETVEVTAASPVDFPVEPAVFEITTDSGESWVSTDGQTWKRKP